MKIFLSSVVVIIICYSNAALACCDEDHFYTIQKIKPNDVLNVRLFPHPSAPISGKIKPNSKEKISIFESSAVGRIECLNQTLNDNAVNKSFQAGEDETVLKPYESKMVSAPGSKGTPKGMWCYIQHGKNLNGWVNASFLKYKCSETIGETGSRHPCKPRDDKSK